MTTLSPVESSDEQEVQATVVEVTADRFEAIYPLLRELNASVPKETWKRLFDYEWGQDEKHKGLALVSDGQYVGFLGMIFSQKEINGKLEKFCNLACWFVHEAYRNQSLSLILPVMGLKKYTIFNLTPTPTAHAIFSKLGFKELDRRLMILPPTLSAFNSSVELLSAEKLTNPESILSPKDMKILNDHRPYPCEHLILRDTRTDEYCYILANKANKKNIDFAYIHYLSNKQIFWQNTQILKWHFFKTFRTLFTLVDERHDIPERKTFCLYYNLRAPKLFRSSQVKREDVDHLYSELLLLNS